ncbi:UDP-N-acetylmuramate--L-alanine ligase [Pedobacter puniceum]|uniref:Peptidoglycan synthetase n=1 Tax=Pedobacter puniceum TaxID=2666136 RepID=A0A7K0FTH3_9SPHI|nr:Mur ligase family protein [Pedobacter puniceum]MRX48417.1 peptidoglycan synthetase [Pedobacter puniceum]
MRVHFIAIGGAAMHNLAIALHLKGFKVTGSDDVVYEPSKSRLNKYGLLPVKEGWNEANISAELDAVILGMHAKADNPELLKAQELNIPIYSYPEYIYEQSKQKKRIVVGGSHGKTTITSMILHVLKYHQKDFDYLVGAQIEGFDNMVGLSNAPLIIIEGDEYLASPIDRRPKFHLYKAHVGIISGVAWDHINVFPTFENYKEQFTKFIDTLEPNGTLIYCEDDAELKALVEKYDNNKSLNIYPYQAHDAIIKSGKTFLLVNENEELPLEIFGAHNLMNLNAAKLACLEAGVTEGEFYEAIKYFKGAARRLEKLAENEHTVIYKDFAHSPSKLKATVGAVKQQFPERKLIACIELHTFSSLNRNFLNEYAYTLNQADYAIVFIDDKTLKQKGMQAFTAQEILDAFKSEDIKFFNQPEKIKEYLLTFQLRDVNLLLMSSGNFGGIDLVTLANKLLIN